MFTVLKRALKILIIFEGVVVEYVTVYKNVIKRTRGQLPSFKSQRSIQIADFR